MKGIGMKIFKRFILFFLMSALLVVTTNGVTYALVSTVQVLKRVVIINAKIESEGYQVIFIQIDNIRKGIIDSQTYPLKSGNKYGIIVVGDEDRIQDIDLKVYDQNGNLVGKDNDSENIAMVKVSPHKSQKYKISVSAYKMDHTDGFYGVIIYREK